MEKIAVVELGLTDYPTIAAKMREHILARNQSHIWITQHHSCYTLGQNNTSRLPKKSEIPVYQSDRGGQITYHGPGQLIFYMLLNLKLHNCTVKQLVINLEKACIATLATKNISAHVLEKKPGVYVDNAKIASLGLRMRNNFSYHGLSLNVDMDLQPFNYIDPCGYAGLQMTNITNFTNDYTYAGITETFVDMFLQTLQRE